MPPMSRETLRKPSVPGKHTDDAPAEDEADEGYRADSLPDVLGGELAVIEAFADARTQFSDGIMEAASLF
jgi:hypothetical protein